MRIPYVTRHGAQVVISAEDDSVVTVWLTPDDADEFARRIQFEVAAARRYAEEQNDGRQALPKDP
jgi:hypothetical protein